MLRPAIMNTTPINPRLALLQHLGIEIPKNSRILDFGCGAGNAVYAMMDQGFTRVIGYDVKDYLELREPADRDRFFVMAKEGSNLLPFEDCSFDLIISEQVLEHVKDQVTMHREMFRILRHGGYAVHEWPARYRIIEPHIFVPFGGFIGHRWWFKLWALVGIRNEFQQGLSADEVADRNAYYFVDGLNYVPNSCCQVVWKKLGFGYRWIEQAHFETSGSALIGLLGRMNRVIPGIGWLYRNFHERFVVLSKPPLIALATSRDSDD
jgi:SAM-dependent methyltransferase